MAGLETNSKLRKKNKTAVLLTFFILFLVITSAGALVSFRYVTRSMEEKDKNVEIVIPPEKEIRVEIPLGSNTEAIAKILQKEGIISRPFLFKMMSKINGYNGQYKSGTHIVSKELNYDQLMRVLTSNPVSVSATIPEGKTYAEIRNILSGKKVIDKAKFDKTANNEKFDYKFLEGLPQRENRLEGYLFPDTYYFDLKAGEKEVIKKMLDNFNSKFKPEYYKKAKNLNMSVDQIVILASIIEREARIAEERKVIAGVFYNRLRSKDKSLRKLQSCATIQYIFLNKEGKVKEKLTEKDTMIQDPYNTYQTEGLPPGPICSPGIDAIEAALNPQNTDFWYFVSKGDGTHQFSKTLAEHQAAVKKYGLN